MAQVQILKVATALVQGARGERGGAPSKDSVMGLAQIDNALVKFAGRRGGVMHFKTEPLAKKDTVLADFEGKLTKTFKSTEGLPYQYTVTTDEVIAPSVLATQFYKARSAAKVNTRSTKARKSK